MNCQAGKTYYLIISASQWNSDSHDAILRLDTSMLYDDSDELAKYGEDYLSALVAEEGGTLDGNTVTINGITKTYDDTNSRIEKGRIIVNAFDFANDFTNMDELNESIAYLNSSNLEYASVGETVYNDVYEGDISNIMGMSQIYVAPYGDTSENVRRIQKILKRE